MSGNATQQVVVVTQNSLRNNQDTVQMALFNTDGTPHVVGQQAAAQADLAALTSAAAVGATPTKAEFDKVVVDLAASRTLINSLLAKMRTAKQLAP
jgi:hypothetical protein